MEAVAAVLRSGKLFRDEDHKNSQCTQFEREACQLLGVSYGLLVNSGTNALIAGLIGLGIGPGDEVIVPAYTYIATAAAVVAVGAVPVIAEIDDSLGLDPEDVRRKITPHTRCIIPVSHAGGPLSPERPASDRRGAPPSGLGGLLPVHRSSVLRAR
ncbi:MAG: hypothetical protein KatS3mg115_0007 [Candidatus Poribacteria bacterium]|nr:MAG: hypothetical protein KatS3mg115_0007 [Candidatus Poribacteria bacterium]